MASSVQGVFFAQAAGSDIGLRGSLGMGLRWRLGTRLRTMFGLGLTGMGLGVDACELLLVPDSTRSTVHLVAYAIKRATLLKLLILTLMSVVELSCFKSICFALILFARATSLPLSSLGIGFRFGLGMRPKMDTCQQILIPCCTGSIPATGQHCRNFFFWLQCL